MKSNHPELHQRYMLLFKIDAKNLFHRIKERQHEYIEIFSLKRSRSIFKDVFDNRYAKASAFDLSHCPQEVIEALDQFYTKVDELYWYLKHTQDMPNTIEDEVSRKVTRLGKAFRPACPCISTRSSLGALTEEGSERIEREEDIPPADIHSDAFQTGGELWEADEQEEYLRPKSYADPGEEREKLY